LNRAALFLFAFLSAFSVPRSEHPRPSDAHSPFQNPLRASARCGLLPPGKLWSPSADSVQSPREWVATAHPPGKLITLEGTLRYREVEDEVKGTTFKHRIAEVHATSMKRLSKVEAADDPSDGADDE